MFQAAVFKNIQYFNTPNPKQQHKGWIWDEPLLDTFQRIGSALLCFGNALTMCPPSIVNTKWISSQKAWFHPPLLAGCPLRSPVLVTSNCHSSTQAPEKQPLFAPPWESSPGFEASPTLFSQDSFCSHSSLGPCPWTSTFWPSVNLRVGAKFQAGGCSRKGRREFLG